MLALDLFSAAAGGWTLGLHRAGFKTIAACEIEAWRRALYAENNPDVRLYDNILTLTGAQILADLGTLPGIIVGSPPCQDISSANTKGKGVDGSRSILFFEAIRIIGECRPRWFALENSSNLRTKGADRVLARLEALGYTCQAFVVGAEDVGANHERKRVWIIGFDAEQVADALGVGRFPWTGSEEGPDTGDHRDISGHRDTHGEDQTPYSHGHGRSAQRSWGRSGIDLSIQEDAALDTESLGREGRGTRGCGPDGDDGAHHAQGSDGDTSGDGRTEGREGRCPDADAGLSDNPHLAVAGSSGLGEDDPEPWADWNGGLSRHLRDDDGLSLALAERRFLAPGGGRNTLSGASLIIEAFGDAVLPQIPEAIGRAILRVEEAMAVLNRERA